MTSPKPKAPITTGNIAKAVFELSRSHQWAIADQALADERWVEALDALDELDNQARSIRTRLSSISTKVNRRHWSPLLGGR